MSTSNDPPRAPTCTPAMKRVLKNLHAGRAPWSHLRGRSMHGAAGQTERALLTRGLAERRAGRLSLTEAGRRVAAEDL